MLRKQEILILLLNKSLLVLFFPSVPSVLLFAPLDGLRFFHCVLPKGTCKNTPRLVHAPSLHSSAVPRASWQRAADAQRRPLPLRTPVHSGRQARLCVPATCSLTLFTLLLNTASACVNSLAHSAHTVALIYHSSWFPSFFSLILWVDFYETVIFLFVAVPVRYGYNYSHAFISVEWWKWGYKEKLTWCYSTWIRHFGRVDFFFFKLFSICLIQLRWG